MSDDGTDGSKKPKGIPRGTWEWGKILYEEPWAKHRRFKKRDTIAIGIVIISTGILSILTGVLAIVTEPSSVELAIIMWAVSIVIFWIGSYLISDEVKRMPFCVYERGYTSNRVSFSDGYHRRQVFIPAHLVRGVDVSDYIVRGKRGVGTFRTLILRYLDDEQGEHELYLILSDIDHWYSAFLALDKILEGIINDELRESMKKLKAEWDSFEAKYGMGLGG